MGFLRASDLAAALALFARFGDGEISTDGRKLAWYPPPTVQADDIPDDVRSALTRLGWQPIPGDESGWWLDL
jgi:hypothetical protein